MLVCLGVSLNIPGDIRVVRDAQVSVDIPGVVAGILGEILVSNHAESAGETPGDFFGGVEVFLEILTQYPRAVTVWSIRAPVPVFAGLKGPARIPDQEDELQIQTAGKIEKNWSNMLRIYIFPI